MAFLCQSKRTDMRVSLIASWESFTQTRAREIGQMVKYLPCAGPEFSPWNLHYRKSCSL